MSLEAVPFKQTIEDCLLLHLQMLRKYSRCKITDLKEHLAAFIFKRFQRGLIKLLRDFIPNYESTLKESVTCSFITK